MSRANGCDIHNNRLTAINIPGQGQITNIYDQAHWNSPAKTMLPGGSATDYSYDPLMQLANITAKDPGQNPLVTRNYQYSPAGNITSKNTEHGNYTYQYDDLYRLTQADNPALPDESYTYDALGNRLTAEGVPGTWTYNANNELTGYATVSFNYDANGNTTQKTINGVTTKYIYDTEDRLTEVRDGADALIASYYYDPFGRRLWKEVDGTRTYFLYSDEGLIGEYDSTGTEIKTYGWAPGSQWSTDPFFVKTGGTYYWYQNDHLGTPQKITATNGSVVWAATYDSFGNAQIDIENITNNLRFPGMYFDVETGLYYNLQRYYDPTTGKYLSTDPFGQGLNLYAYVFNNPNSLVDPLGLCAIRKFTSLQGQAEFWAGFGDTISFGGTKWIRDQWNEALEWNDSIDYTSGFYSAGKWSGYAWELSTGIAGATKYLGKNALLYGVKAGSAAGSIVGGISFTTELAMGRSFEAAAKSGIVSGITTAVNVGLTSAGQSYLVAASAAFTTNIIFQHSLNNNVNIFSAALSAIPSSVGHFFLSQSGEKGMSIAVTTGIISGPLNVALNAFSE